jgi:HEAT repeat protein
VISRQLLNIAMFVELGLLVLAVILFFAHGLWLFFSERRIQRLTALGRDSLAHLATRGTVNLEEIEALRRLPHDVQVIAFLEMSRHLSGAAKERLSFVAGQVGVVDRARKLCDSNRWSRRLRGARILSRLDVVDPLVQRLLLDPHPAVRAQAAEWAGAQPSVTVISAMLKLLADPATQARFAVQNALLRMGAVVAGPLATFLERNSGRAAEAGLRVAESLAEPRFGAAALRLSRTSDVGVRIAAARLLGAVGDAGGAERLIELLEDDDPSVRAAAAQGLGRMQHWKAASLLASRLRDSAWRVRRAAGLALRSIGAPGALFLRRALKGDDAFAADMAQQVLDLPAAAASA